MGRETKQYRDFEGFGQSGGGPFNILDIKIDAGGVLAVVIRAGVPPARRRVHFEGVTDLDFYTSGGADW